MIFDHGLIRLGFCPQLAAEPGFREKYTRPDTRGHGSMADAVRALGVGDDVGDVAVSGPDPDGWLHAERAFDPAKARQGELAAPVRWGGLQALLFLSRVSLRPDPAAPGRHEVRVLRRRPYLSRTQEEAERLARRMAWLACRGLWFAAWNPARIEVRSILPGGKEAATVSVSAAEEADLAEYAAAVVEWEAGEDAGWMGAPALPPRTENCLACRWADCPSRVDPPTWGNLAAMV